MTREHIDSGRDHFVYRLYDVDGNLLYVGCTKRLDRRRQEHMAQRPAMIAATSRIRLEGPYPRSVARAIESKALRKESPFFGWTPAKHRIQCQRNRWVKERIRDLVMGGVEPTDAIRRACHEVEDIIRDPYAPEREVLDERVRQERRVA